MFAIKGVLVFLVASLLLNITPGPDMLYVITRSTAQGRRAGVVSALAIGSGCIVHTTAAALGFSALFLYSAFAFEVVKWIGALYLLYLGVRTLLKKEQVFELQQVRQDALWKIYRQGVMINVLNPKVALFFLAFLPQFIEPGLAHPALQIVVLGTLFNIGGTLVNLLVALLFGYIGMRIMRQIWVVRVQKWITGSVFLALGLNLALVRRQ